MIPVLRRGVRLSWDARRGRRVLLYPEGVLVLTETAAAVLARCDGRDDTAQIVAGLTEEFDAVPAVDVEGLLHRLVERHLVSWT